MVVQKQSSEGGKRERTAESSVEFDLQRLLTEKSVGAWKWEESPTEIDGKCHVTSGHVEDEQILLDKNTWVVFGRLRINSAERTRSCQPRMHSSMSRCATWQSSVS